MFQADHEGTLFVDHVQVLLSTQRALVGALGHQVLGVSVHHTETTVLLDIFIDGVLAEDEYDELDVISTEILADFPEATAVNLNIKQNCNSPLSSRGQWVYLLRDVKVISV